MKNRVSCKTTVLRYCGCQLLKPPSNLCRLLSRAELAKPADPTGDTTAVEDIGIAVSALVVSAH